MNDIQVDAVDPIDTILTDPVKRKGHVNALDGQAQVYTADHWAEDVLAYRMAAITSPAAEDKRKYVVWATDYLGLGSAARKDANPTDKLPVFHITINKGAMQMRAVDPLTNDIIDVFDATSMAPTDQMHTMLGINDDLGDLDA